MNTIIVDGRQAVRLQSAMGDVQAEWMASLVSIDAMLATLSAARAEVLAQAHQWSKLTEESVVAVGAKPELRSELARRSFVAEVACALRVPESSADRLVAESDMLVERLPVTLGALAEGRLGYAQARVIIDEAYGMSAGVAAQFEAGLVEAGCTSTATRLRVKARRVREALEPATIQARTKTAMEKRFVAVDPGKDGMGWLTLHAQAAVLEGIHDRLQQGAIARRADGDPRTLTQLRADIAAALLLDGLPRERAAHADRGRLAGGPRGGCETAGAAGAGGETAGTPDGDRRVESAAGRGELDGRGSVFADGGLLAGLDFPVDLLAHIRPQVMVSVPVLTLMGVTDQPGSLNGCIPIDADTARRLAAHAPSFTRLLTHPQTEAVLSVGRDSYRVPADLRQWLRIRDGLCRFPGCTRRAVHTEIDHTAQWQGDGLTQYDNLACLCAKHHHLKDQTVWRLTQRDRGVLEWTSPAGRTYLTEPQTELPTPTVKPPGEPNSDPGPPDKSDSTPNYLDKPPF